MNKKKHLILTLITVLITICFDQISKYIVNSMIKLSSTKVIIPEFFSITNARNYGAAWSILWNQKFYIILITCVALLFVLFLLFKEKNTSKYTSLYYGLLIGGIIGNLIDRIVLGYVVDFLDFTFFGFHYPIFNISDVAIVISVLLICAECFLPDTVFNKVKNDEVEVLEFDE